MRHDFVQYNRGLRTVLSLSRSRPRRNGEEAVVGVHLRALVAVGFLTDNGLD
jgi:hypothetical protein